MTIEGPASVAVANTTECKIVGPYLPVGDTDWECRTHDVLAVPRNPDRDLARDLRRQELRCPVAEPDTTAPPQT